MESQTIQCPNCSALVPAENINIAALVGKCVNCNHVFALPLENLKLPAAGPAQQPPPACPSGVICETGPSGELYIRRRWFQPMLIFLLFFCIFWDGFLIFWYAMALFGPMNGRGAGNAGFWLPLLFPLLHVSVGVGLTYFVLAGFFNSTRILVDDDFVHIRHGPIPWRGNRDVPRAELRGIEVDLTYSNNGQPQCCVTGNNVDGRQITLLSSLSHRQANYIGYQIANHIGINYSGCDSSRMMIPLPRWLRKWTR